MQTSVHSLSETIVNVIIRHNIDFIVTCNQIILLYGNSYKIYVIVFITYFKIFRVKVQQQFLIIRK